MRGLPFSLLSLAAVILAPLVQSSSTIRNPISRVHEVRNASISTFNHRVTALSEFDLNFIIRDDVHVRLRLEPNHDILGDDATVTYLAADGSVARQETIDRLGHKVYKGSAWIRRPRIGQHQYQRVGWARATVLEDGDEPFFEGAFAVNHDHHHIQSADHYLQTRHPLDPDIESLDHGSHLMVVWRDSDIVSQPALARHDDLRRSYLEDRPKCQADGLTFNLQPDHPVYAGMASRKTGLMTLDNVFGRRAVDNTTGGNSAGVNLVSSIGSTAGCPTTRKVALVGVATDCTYTAAFNSTESMRQNVISQMNTASALWESTFNISLGLQNLTASNESCPGTPPQATLWNQACSNSVGIQDRLNYFSKWRGNQRDNNSHWTLMSTCNDGSAVGLAWLGQACAVGSQTTNTSSTGNGSPSGQEISAGANVVVRTPGASEWQIIAHETGHTYGAVHDCTSQTCADPNTVNAQQCCPLSAGTCDAGQQYIMNPATSQGITHFSPCSIGNICSAMGRNSVNTSCLTNNKAVTTINGQQCGNGIVEQGEECDCGGPSGCGNNPCCNPTTCKFTTGSVCDDSNDDCCRSCQLATNGTVCRASTGPCDPQEVCSGSSAVCPADKTAPNGQSCGKGLQCASGQCTNRDDQCKSVMGSYTQGNDTYACDSSGCVISCASPEFGAGICYGMQQNFLDGTPCDGSGRCQNGQCKGATVGGQVKSWLDDHKTLVIGIAASIGALLLFSLLGCLFRYFRRASYRSKVQPAPMPPPGGWQGWNKSQQPIELQQPYPNYYSQWTPPPPPPPVRTQSARWA